MEKPFRLPSINDFKLIKPISRGAFGKVFLATKTDSTGLYAIKILSKEEMKRKNLVDKITAERNALAVSKCPYIVHLYYSLQTVSHIYLVMEYLIGGDLKTLLIVLGYLKDMHAAIYTVEISIALEYLHSHGIIHRDLKPDNILITAAGHLKLTDFGLSTLSWNRPIRASDVLNTPSVTNLPVEFYRTPGQLISLTTELSFAHSPVKNPVPKLDELSFSSSNYPNENTLPERHENVGDTAFNPSICSSNQMAAERLTFDLTSQLDHDAKERLMWRHHILQQIQTIESSQTYGSVQHAANSPSLSSPKPAHGQKAISLSEVIHEGSLLTLTELFAGAEPQETDAINAFLIKFSESELLRVGLLVRQLSMPIFCSPPFRSHDPIDTSDSSPKLPQVSSLGPLRRCKSYSQPETRMPYRTHRIRRLCPLPWSPTMIKEASVTNLNSFRRAVLPPLPHCPEQQDSDDAMESEKENVRTDFANVDSGSRDNTDAQSKTGLPQPAAMFGSPKWPPLSVPTTSSSPQTVISPLRGELVHLHLTPHVRQSISPEPATPTVSPSVQFTNSPLTSDAFRLATTPSMFAMMAHKTGPELPLSSVEKIRLQQLYSPALLSVEDLRYGLNLAEVDPAHPYMPCLAGSPQLRAQTPLRTPRLVRRHSSNAGLKTHPCHFPTASCKAPLESSTLMVNRINPQYSLLQRLHFDSGSDKNTPLSVIPETAYPHATDQSFHNTVRFMNPCCQPCAPPSSPVASAVCESVARFCCANPRLLGTPEYIAPELLTQSAAGAADTPETPAVDWWSLGVILFEMLTGSTPFADETPGAVFQNILNLDIPWPCKSSGSNCSVVPSSDDQFDPEELSSDAIELISALLARSPSERLQTASRLRTFHFLSAVGDWSRLDQMEMPFVPCPEDSTDTSYFHVRNELNAYDLTTSGTDLTLR
ncbi:hypothetical protein P879_03274 [Paragonimus westermani]|uniref:Serine/threonine-protein kinase greatwall n=1 Tax=Paragonimus westermani TaxID=34504 RepID=A0A8T0DNS3_9TREM|nr:hypothetical protein P879_03274 [Paragonimus westermani]